MLEGNQRDKNIKIKNAIVRLNRIIREGESQTGPIDEDEIELIYWKIPSSDIYIIRDVLISSLQEINKTNFTNPKQQIEELTGHYRRLAEKKDALAERVHTLENDIASSLKSTATGKKPGKPPAQKDINLDELRELYAQNLSLNEIGRRMGHSPHTVKKYLIELGLLNK